MRPLDAWPREQRPRVMLHEYVSFRFGTHVRGYELYDCYPLRVNEETGEPEHDTLFECVLGLPEPLEEGQAAELKSAPCTSKDRAKDDVALAVMRSLSAQQPPTPARSPTRRTWRCPRWCHSLGLRVPPRSR